MDAVDDCNDPRSRYCCVQTRLPITMKCVLDIFALECVLTGTFQRMLRQACMSDGWSTAVALLNGCSRSRGLSIIADHSMVSTSRCSEYDRFTEQHQAEA